MNTSATVLYNLPPYPSSVHGGIFKINTSPISRPPASPSINIPVTALQLNALRNSLGSSTSSLSATPPDSPSLGSPSLSPSPTRGHIIDPSSSEYKKRKRGRPPLEKDSRHCTNCGTTTTPEWRKGPQGPHTLCNACGLQYMKAQKKENSVKAKHSLVRVLNNSDGSLSGSPGGQVVPSSTPPTSSSALHKLSDSPTMPNANAHALNSSHGLNSSQQSLNHSQGFTRMTDSPPITNSQGLKVMSLNSSGFYGPLQVISCNNNSSPNSNILCLSNNDLISPSSPQGSSICGPTYSSPTPAPPRVSISDHRNITPSLQSTTTILQLSPSQHLSGFISRSSPPSGVPPLGGQPPSPANSYTLQSSFLSGYATPTPTTTTTDSGEYASPSNSHMLSFEPLSPFQQYQQYQQLQQLQQLHQYQYQQMQFSISPPASGGGCM